MTRDLNDLERDRQSGYFLLYQHVSMIMGFQLSWDDYNMLINKGFMTNYSICASFLKREKENWWRTRGGELRKGERGGKKKGRKQDKGMKGGKEGGQ